MAVERPTCPVSPHFWDGSLKIATYNVNGIVGRLPVLLRWLKEDQPDVVCLQELKTIDANFPRKELEKAGYGAVWHGQKSWNGVAILCKGSEPRLTRRDYQAIRTTVKAVISKRLSTALSSAACICQTAILRPARNSTTSSNGSNGFSDTRRILGSWRCLPFWSATSTSCPPISTSTSRSAGGTMRFSAGGA